MMTPYLWLQLRYVVAGAGLALLCWLAVRRLPGIRRLRSAVLQLGAALVLIALSSALVVEAMRMTAWRGSSRFGIVALPFYAACLWLPLLGAIAFVRRWRAGRRRDWSIAACSALLVAIGIHATLIEPNRLHVVQRTIPFAGWPADAPPVRIVHISDLQTTGACERERRAVELINALVPDVIVCCGDYLAGPYDDPEPAIAAARAFLGALRARHGIVCVAGHSESEALRERVLDGLPVRYLHNESWLLELGGGRRLRIVGLTTAARAFECVLPDADARRMTIVASHVPDISRQLIGRGIDLHLAGHTHGGQIVVPLLGPPVTLSALPRRYATGLHWFDDHYLNVSPGLGMEGHHAPRIRLFCPPSIDLLLLTNTDQLTIPDQSLSPSEASGTPRSRAR